MARAAESLHLDCLGAGSGCASQSRYSCSTSACCAARNSSIVRNAYFRKKPSRASKASGPAPARPATAIWTRHNPYAQDLDLFGKGSLFELLCTARTYIGEDTLARWLLTPAAPDAVHARHDAVNELRPRLDLREDLGRARRRRAHRRGPRVIGRMGRGHRRCSKAVGCALVAALLTVLGVCAACAIVAPARLQLDLLRMSESAATLCATSSWSLFFINSFSFLYRSLPLRKRVDSVVRRRR